MQPVFRFAPSPNGYLHLGHACSALTNARMAEETGGRLLLRIEDIDTTRCTEALVKACLDDLAWLGLEWEEPVLRQSAHFARYRALTKEMEAQGLLYPCFCTRAEIARAAGDNPARDPEGAPLYPGTCRHLAPGLREARRRSGEPHALRLDMAAAMERVRGSELTWRELSGGGPAMSLVEARPEKWGDVVLVRKECPTSYHLSVVLDDALQGVTHVVRGADLHEATAIHRLLQVLLGLPEPCYHHHALITDNEGRKLAKSALSKPIRALRAEGMSAADIRRGLGFEGVM